MRPILIRATKIEELSKKQILPLYRHLLEWNELNYTGTAKFFVSEDGVYLQDVRRLDLIDPPEVVYSIQTLIEMAKKYSATIRKKF